MAAILLDDVLIHRDMRLRGGGLVRGWSSFTAACSVSAIAGVLIGAAWTDAVTALHPWRRLCPG